MSDLLVKVAIDESGVQSQLKGIMGKFRSAAKAMAAVTVPAAAVLGIVKSVDALANLGEQAINAAGSLQDTANEIGITAERLQELRILGKQSGVEFGQMDKALSMLNNVVGQAALGQGEFEKYLSSAGIELRTAEGRVKSVASVYEDLSEVVRSGSLTQAQAVALARQAFGREGAAIVNVLRMTADEQKKVIETAREFGAVLSNEVVASADAYGDKLDLIKQGTEALDTQTKLVLAPLTLKWAQLKNEIAGATAELMRASGMIDDNAALKQRRLRQLESTINAHRDYLELVKHPDPMSDSLLQNWVAEWSALKSEIAAADEAAREAAAAIVPTGGIVDGESDPAETDAARRAREKSRETQNEWFMAIQEARDAAELRDQEYYQSNLEAATQWQQDVEAARAEMLAREDQWYIDRNDSALAFQEAREELAARELAYAREHEGLLTQAKREGAEARAAFEQDATSRQVATVIDGLASMTAGVAQHNKKMFNVNKVAAIAQAIMSTYAGAAKAIETYPPPLSFAMAGLQLAAGMAHVQAIRSTTFGGGGRGTTPSSAGSTPTVNGQPTQGSGSAPQRLVVQGISAESLFTGSAVRNLAERLLQFQSDGGKVVLQ